jgi:putative transposase
VPETVSIDECGAGLAALEASNADREASIRIRLPKISTSSSNRAIERRTLPMLGFKTFRCVRISLAGI